MPGPRLDAEPITVGGKGGLMEEALRDVKDDCDLCAGLEVVRYVRGTEPASTPHCGKCHRALRVELVEPRA